jgi:dynein heavy chain
LKEWPAFHALKRTVDDFNDMCPLLELMANKAMKPRHWQRIMEVLKHNFDLESENFCLKNILEAPLLKYKEDIEVSLHCWNWPLCSKIFFLENYRSECNKIQ